MSTRRVQPPWNYLHEASVPSLESYELSRLNHAANLRREIAALLDQWIEDNTQALLARWLREDRQLPPLQAECIDDHQSSLPFDELPAVGESPRRVVRPLKLARRNARRSRAW